MSLKMMERLIISKKEKGLNVTRLYLECLTWHKASIDVEAPRLVPKTSWWQKEPLK